MLRLNLRKKKTMIADNLRLDRKPTQSEIEENIIEWTTFYRRNLDLFTIDILEINLKLFQRQLLLELQEGEVSDVVTSRGLSKTFMTAIFAMDMALLYSNQEILITSFTLSQSNLIISDKIDKELSHPATGISPVLRQLRADGWFKFKKDKNTDAEYIEFANNSKIFAVNCGESARGKRSTIIITDECVLIKKKDYQGMIEPTQRPRPFNGRPSDYKEEPKQVFLTSAKTKTNWFWKHLVSCVNGHYNDKNIKYNFYAGDIFTAVANGIQSKMQYIQRKKNVDDMSFAQEYLNEFLGNSEKSLFKFEDFDKNQNIVECFLPRNVEQIILGEENTYDFKDGWVRCISVDIAVASGNENDMSVFVFFEVNPNTGIIRFPCIKTFSGLNSIKQAILMKRWFYEYKASYFIMDCNGVGLPIYDLLTVETVDVEVGAVYPAWSVCEDKSLQIASDKVVNDRIQRTISTDIESVIIPFVGTTEINSQMHLLMRKNLKDGKINLLIDDAEAQVTKEDKNPSFVLKSPEEKAELLDPYLQTRLMVNESVSLEMKLMENGSIKLQEANRMDTKDKYIACAMANFLGDKIYNKHSKDSYGSDFDIDDFSEIYNY